MFVGVRERESCVLTDRVEQRELLTIERVVDSGRIDVDRAEGLLSECDGGADRAADLVLLDRIT